MRAGTSLRDRTAEFQSIAERLQKAQGASAGPYSQNGGAAAHNPAKAAVLQQSEFARKASQIGLAIHKTSMKLQKLAQLAKRTSMFDDPSLEIDELTGIIKRDIQSLNDGIAELQRVSARRGDAANKQSEEHSHTVVDSLRTRLKDATAEFKEVLTLRTDNLKVHNERRQLFSSQPDASSSLLERTPLLAAGGDSSGARTASSLFGGQPGGGGGGGAMQQQLALQQTDGYLSSRAEALQNVEATIVELGSIFTQLAEMVQAQGEMAQRIDENVEETLGNVDSAKAQLMRYLNSISSNRMLMIKVFLVLMLFMAVFVLFVA
ncbi:syntaxin-like [Raphidocelis subcapitata]|uniref:Syntaxin-like n=1 Tax=Raphidocelis subcapitata TaxID=307507 RepID=A0A2V0P3R3_9CHLO|nr:syntaxin-like [Raphidocelis subcapitata]|eukprot:GBF92493.1 syntaxin-like [Raphidocelis subcapitata]